MARKRNYKKEDRYEDSPKQVKRREGRNRARSLMAKAGKVHKGDGKDVNHKNTNSTDNKRSNLNVETKRKNRSFARTKGAHKKFNYHA